MIGRLIQNVVLLVAFGLWNALFPAYAADEALVSALLAKRQSLVTENRVDIGEMSKAIRSAIADGERLERDAKYRLALDRLLDLQKFAPLSELPSFDVQMLSSWLYKKTGDSNLATAYGARADAMREILLHRIGSGISPDMPVQAMMYSDVVEWARAQLARITDAKSYPYKGRELLAVTCSGPTTGNKPSVIYFEIDPRVQAKLNLQESLFSPIPLEKMKPEHRVLFEQAMAKREAFLIDMMFPYLELIGKVKTATAKAAQLDLQGKPEEAISVLKEIEVIRPIEGIPLPHLIGMYSFLNGKVGNQQKQIELRGFLFGINQVIAHSGDGLSAKTAVHVIAIEEEYAWLSDKRLNRVTQRVLDTDSGKFDVITAKNATGEVRDYYFNITRMYEKYSQGIGGPNSK
jgi:hypothetical protein